MARFVLEKTVAERVFERELETVRSAVEDSDCDSSAVRVRVGRVRVFPVAVRSAVPVSETEIFAEIETVRFETERDTEAVWSAVPVTVEVRAAEMVGVFLVGVSDAE